MMENSRSSLQNSIVEITVVGGGAQRGFLTRQRPLLRIGRSEAVDFCINADKRMSRVHVELELIDDSVLLRNLSSQGTRIGQDRCFQLHILKHDQVFSCGETSFRVLVNENVQLDKTAVMTMADQEATVEVGLGPGQKAGYDQDGVFHSGYTGVLASKEASHRLLNSWRFKTVLKDPGQRGRLGFVFLLFALSLAIWSFAWPLLQVDFSQPWSVTKALALSLATALPPVFFYKLLDLNGQVKWFNYLGALAWGASVGAGWALLSNSSGGVLIDAQIDQNASYVAVIVIAPLREEIFKGLGLLILFVMLYDSFDNALEGLVLGAACGLGFAAVENFVYFGRFLDQGGDRQLLYWGSYRGILFLPISHPLYTAFTGAGFGFCREMVGQRTRYGAPLFGLLFAVGLHMAWNGAVVATGFFGQAEESVYRLLLTTFILGGMAFTLFVCLVMLAISREREILENWLRPELIRGFVTEQELESLRGLRSRLKYERQSLALGWTVFWLRRRLRKAQVALALRKWHLNLGSSRREQLGVDVLVLDCRTRIRDVRNLLANLDSVPIS
jgi:protease PrsW